MNNYLIGVINRLKKDAFLFYVFLLASVSACVSYAIITNRWPDIYLQVVLMMNKWGPEVYSHILYFLLVRSITFSSTNLHVVFLAIIFLLAFFTIWKYIIIYRLTGRYARENNIRISGSVIAFMSFCLCLVHSIPYRWPNWYIGQFTGNIWHNPTTIMLVPFALLQFGYSLDLLRGYDRVINNKLILFTILAILIKPNFFICYAIIFPPLLLVRNLFRLDRRFYLSMAHVLAGGVILIIEYVVTYQGNKGKADILVRPFLVWDFYVNSRLTALITSVFFPLLYSLLNFKYVIKNTMLTYAWLLFISGLCLFILFCESGPRMFDANFIWQMVPCTLILFVAITLDWLKTLSQKRINPWGIRNGVFTFSFLLHVMAGALYIPKLIRFGFR